MSDLAITTVGKIRRLASWPHGFRRPEHGTKPCYPHQFSQQPAKDGRIYLVCRKCGYTTVK